MTKRELGQAFTKAIVLLASIVLTNDRIETPRQRRALRSLMRTFKSKSRTEPKA